MSSADAHTVLGPGLSVRGHITSEETTVIQGRVQGHIEANADVSIHPGAQVHADITARNLEVGGALEGHIQVTDRVSILAGAVVTGTLAAPRVLLADGAKFRGYINTQGEREEVIDAILNKLDEGHHHLRTSGAPKWGHAKQ